MRKFLILDDQLRYLALRDLDTACRAIQDKMGVTDGGVASIVFSGFDWDKACTHSRLNQLRHYVKVQAQYLD